MAKTEQKPTVARMVHYLAKGHDKPHAAVISAVEEQDGATVVSLTIFGPTGVYHAHNVAQSDEPQTGHWNWPAKV